MSKFDLKRANANDVELLFHWANDKAVRANSFNTAPISYEEHKEWFEKKIKSDDSIIFIYYYENTPIGQIRIDINNDEGLIAYSIDQKYRFFGHGKIILQLLETVLKKDYPQIQYLHARVKHNNVASQVKFEQLHYEKILDTEEYLEYRKHACDFESSLPQETSVRGGGHNIPNEQ